MKLNESQIKDLFHFTERHYVEHYDVQVEIVDHLASAIEERLSKNPNQVFEQVLDDVYQGFGPMGLSGFVDSMEERVVKRNRKLLWKEFFTFFTIPKIFLTVCLLLGFYLLFQVITLNTIRIYFLGVIFISFVLVFSDYFRRKRKMKKGFIGWKQALQISFGGALLSFVNLILNGDTFTEMQFFREAAASFLAFYTVFTLAELHVLKQVYCRLQKEFPEAFD